MLLDISTVVRQHNWFHVAEFEAEFGDVNIESSQITSQSCSKHLSAMFALYMGLPKATHVLINKINI